jgi:hypothetical protein
MTNDSLLGSDWNHIVHRLGGARSLEAGARDAGAFARARAVKCAVDLLRLALAYCLGHAGLRTTAAWAEGSGLARLSNVALLGRLRNMAPWLERLVADVLARDLSKREPGGGRPVRIMDATIVPRAGKLGRDSGGVWRVHAVFDLPNERFSMFELTDESEGERLDRAGVVPGEIRVADRGYVHVAHMRTVLEAGADVVLRTGWRQVRWLDADGAAIDLIAMFKASRKSRIDRTIWIKQGATQPLEMRLIAIKKPKAEAEAAKAKARRNASDRCRDIMPGTLIAAEWMIVLTSLNKTEWSADKVLDLYRVRWRIELAFKRLKSLVGLNGPPGEDAAVAKTHILCHLLAILLTEPLVAALGDSPRLGNAYNPTCGAASASSLPP